MKLIVNWYIAKYCDERDMETLIVTGDKDALQLASDKVKILYKSYNNLNI